MTGGADLPEFTPAELDLLEDALEGCEAPDLDVAAALPDASEAVRARLEDYRELLSLSREALPMEDVPTGVLDDVIVAALSSEPAVSAPRDGESFWTRLRRSFVLPGVVLAGTAAAVLVMMQPPSEPGFEAESSSVMAQADDAREAKEEEKPQGVAQLERAEEQRAGGGEAQADEAELSPSAPPAAAAAAAPAAEDAAPADGLYDAAKREKKAKSADKNAGGYGYGPGSPAKDAEAEDDALAEAPKVDSKFDAAALIEKADTLRERGQCAKARELYEQATGATGMHQARAYAGMGLCAEFEGDKKAAYLHFSQAEEAAPSIKSWIASQEGRTGSMQKSKRKAAPKAKPSSKKSSKKSALENAFE